MFRDPTVADIVRFLDEIGISVEERELVQDTFLPGLSVERGVLLMDQSRLKYPGDLLHEAGHLAVLSGEERKVAGPDMRDDGGFEMAAIAWSYAAALHIGTDLKIVFHADGYRGGAGAILENFSCGRYIGVPVLQWLGMAARQGGEGDSGTRGYPHMIRWLCP